MDKENSVTNSLTEANYVPLKRYIAVCADPKTYDKTYTSTPVLANSYGDWYLARIKRIWLVVFRHFFRHYTDMPATLPGAVETKVAAYCYENTMLKDKQKNGYYNRHRI